MTRVLIVASHPVPYIIPLFRLMEAQGWDFQVAYCSLEGVEAYDDPDFGQAIAWDIPLLEGYPWTHLPNRSRQPGLGRFWGLLNPQLWSLVAEFDVVIVYTGYVYASFWLTALSAKWHRKGFIFSTDTSRFDSRRGRNWKRSLKQWLLPRIYQLGDMILVSTHFGKTVLAELGMPRDRVQVTPFVADNDWWLQQSQQVDRAAVRQTWSIPLAAPVVVFCAKLQPWKRPQDVLQAFAMAAVPESYLLYVGDGVLRSQLETQTQTLELGDRVRFLGFLNQSQLPAVYTAADVLCLSSEYEPFGVVVNEAMLCECAVVVSDRVGARELVQPGENGDIYPFSNVEVLAATFRRLLTQPKTLKRMGQKARQRLETWSPRENLTAQQKAIAFARNRKSQKL